MSNSETTASAAPDGAIAEDVYRPSMVAAYRANPRGSARTGFDPERMAPRWRWALTGVLLIAVTVLAGLLLSVPVGPTGTVAGTNGSDTVLAFPNFTPPASGSEVVLRLDGDRTVTGQVKDSQRGEGGLQVTMLLVELPSGSGLEDTKDGTQVILDQGTRPLLLDILNGDDDQ
ncbi:hypothetical protein ACIBLA_30510 [Streptomyces sp. NPDC050433]|uniref:hypothetical protein n=1 Tax=Streptomyces sp. NPDC050433 TaxID=3365615 RepID=UPI0037998794